MNIKRLEEEGFKIIDHETIGYADQTIEVRSGYISIYNINDGGYHHFCLDDKCDYTAIKKLIFYDFYKVFMEDKNDAHLKVEEFIYLDMYIKLNKNINIDESSPMKYIKSYFKNIILVKNRIKVLKNNELYISLTYSGEII